MSEIDPIYHEIAEKMGLEEYKKLPKLLQKIADTEQARIMVELSNTVEEIADKLALDEAAIEENLEYLYRRGVVAPGRSGWHLMRGWDVLKEFIGSASEKYDDDEVLDLVHEIILESRKDLTERLKRGEEIPPIQHTLRVIPKWRSIKDIPGVLPIEDVREIFRANTPLVVIRCSCRTIRRNRQCCSDIVPLDVCIMMGRRGQHELRRGTGKELTYDEALALLDRLDEFPLVNISNNSNQISQVVCSCCTDCCDTLLNNSYWKPLRGHCIFAKSRFEVEDKPEECTACGDCLNNRCPVNAISMKEYPGLEGERAYTNTEECIGCGLCVLTCPTEARKMKLVRPPEHIPDVPPIID